MENFYLQAVADDLRRRLAGAPVGRVWQPGEGSLLVDFRSPDPRLLLVSVEPSDPALFLTARSPREIEAERSGAGAFAAVVRKRLGGGRLVAVEKPPYDRFVTFVVETYEASGDASIARLVVELTGRSANAYLVDGDGVVLASLRQGRTQRRNLPGDRYTSLVTEPPDDRAERLALLGPTIRRELAVRTARVGREDAVRSLEADLAATAGARIYGASGPRAQPVLATFALEALAAQPCDVFEDVHLAADARAIAVAEARAATARKESLATRLRAARERAERTLAALEADFLATEGAERYREIGESLLAQVTSARPVEGGFVIVDYYADPPAELRVEADRGETPQRVAARHFARYQKARRTREQVEVRSERLSRELGRLRELERAVAEARSEAELADAEPLVDKALGAKKPARRRDARADKSAGPVSGTRRFVSSEGFEILVGRTSAANDALTFKVARPSDLWLHAADYPGSHVVVRNPSRAPLPHKTLLEAAQLAAFYSQAGSNALVEVRYAQRRFVTKPRGAAPGLVRLAEFKTVTVRPSADLDRA